MDDLRASFDQMQDQLLAIVDLINASHKGGVDYGTGDLLSPAEAHTVQAVGDHHGLNLTSLARAMGVTKATMSERVNKLSKKGLLRKSKALDNRKEILITLTERGVLVKQGHEDEHQRMFRFFSSHYGDDAAEKIELFKCVFGEYLGLAGSIKEHHQEE